MHAAARGSAPFHLVILDCHMPEMDGFDLAEAIGAAPSLRGARLIMLTSSGERRAAARAVGIEHYLTKPVRRARLLETVAEAMTGDAPAPAPAPDDAGIAAHADVVEPPAVHPGGVRVLVAEDNEVNQLVISGLLARHGVAVDIAANGREALAQLVHREYAAVIMDCQMPELDGYETTAAIRAGEAGASRARLPIIATTAHAMKGDRERCLDAGMDDYLAKPLRPDALAAVLERWIGTAGVAPAADVEPMPTEGLVDEARMRTFRTDYPEIVDQLVALFSEGSPPLIDALREAAASGDADALRRGAHKLKGSCQNIGATWMATLCSTLETGEADAVTVIGDLDAAFAPTEAAIRRAVAA
jgi:CheY-like chemotaxis protein